MRAAQLRGQSPCIPGQCMQARHHAESPGLLRGARLLYGYLSAEIFLSGSRSYRAGLCTSACVQLTNVKGMSVCLSVAYASSNVQLTSMQLSLV